MVEVVFSYLHLKRAEVDIITGDSIRTGITYFTKKVLVKRESTFKTGTVYEKLTSNGLDCADHVDFEPKSLWSGQ